VVRSAASVRQGEPSDLAARLADAFGAPRAAERGALEATLADAWRAARAEYPGVELDPSSFARFLAERAEGDDRVEALRGLHGADLYLACACALGSPRGLAIFDERVAPRLARAVARIDPSPAFVDEVLQRVRVRLFVGGEGRPPKVGEYRGRGPFAAWSKAVAVRTALNLRAASPERRDEGDADARADEALTDDPELDFLKRRHRGDFQEAFRAALDSLDDREATVLRLHAVDGLSIDQIGALYGAHRATAARWLASARRALWRETSKRLARELRLPPAEVDHLIDLLRSRLDVSLARLLRPKAPTADGD
jgi:RNA polymerase sigma-70 factor (ECF subfamily)